MAYVLPQVLVYQDFDLLPQTTIEPLNAFVFGGHAYLQRYDQASEKATSYLGVYDSTGVLVDGEYKTCYSWPGKPTGAVVDSSYTRVFIDNALLRYFRDTSGTATVSGSVLTLTGTNWKENPVDPDTYPRAATLYDRDVQPGDIIRITGDDGSGGADVTLSTYVKAVQATQVAAAVDATPTADAANQTATTQAASTTAGASNSGTAVIASASAASYNGDADGVMSETYTVTVTQSSTGGDPSTARLRITSASGLDDLPDYQPDSDVFDDTSGVPSAMPVGTRGGTITFTPTDHGSTPTTAFTAGDTWTVVCTQNYDVPSTTAAGTYTGTRDTTYIVEVTTGGAYGAAYVLVSTIDGYDYSGPTVVPVGRTVSIGTRGVTLTFSNTTYDKLVLGDRWYIEVTAATDGNYNKLQLGHNIPAGLTDNIEINLYIKKNIELGDEHIVPGQYNWTQSATELCAMAGVQAYDATWTDSGTPIALDVITDSNVANSNKLYVEYRAWRSDLAVAPLAIYDAADLDDAVSGAITPDNPLKYALYMALQNNNGRSVWYMAVSDPTDTSAWSNVLEMIEDRTDVYGLVPLTRDSTVLGLCQAHVAAQSNELLNRWRVLWTSLASDAVVEVLTADADGNALLGTTEDDPDTSGTQYTRFECEGATFETSGVRAGDVVRYQYVTDAFGNISYSEYVVDSVVNEETLLLVTGTVAAESVGRKFEIWRNLTTAELATVIAAEAGNYADRRVRAVWPDTVTVGSEDVEGYYLCAALAALSGGVPPHQGLTQLEIVGVDSVSRTTQLFSRSQLDQMAEAGVWIVTQNPTGEVYTRHAVTTADYEDINAREEMVVRNVDSISYYMMDQFSPYIGIANVTDSMIDKIGAEARAAIQYLRSANWSTLLGGQLIDGAITELRASPVFRDRIVLALDLEIPYALNNLEIHLIV